MQPDTYDSWLAVAKERSEDARALLESRDQSIGPVYLAGYAVEASLKALLKFINKPFPKFGGAGHNLKSLWKQSGFQLRDIKDSNGARSFFLDCWSTDLRYENTLPVADSQTYHSQDLVKAAIHLANFIKRQIKRRKRKRGRS